MACLELVHRCAKPLVSALCCLGTDDSEDSIEMREDARYFASQGPPSATNPLMSTNPSIPHHNNGSKGGYMANLGRLPITNGSPTRNSARKWTISNTALRRSLDNHRPILNARRDLTGLNAALHRSLKNNQSTEAQAFAQLNTSNDNLKKIDKDTKSAEIHEERGEFYLFIELPPELQAMIWKFHIYMTPPRLIELENEDVIPAVPKNRGIPPLLRKYDPLLNLQHHESDEGTRRHYYRRVSDKSREIPAVFRICKGSYEEAYRIYDRRTFDTEVESNDAESNKNPVYWRPEIDIVYFGKLCCTATLVYLFNPIFGHQCRDIPNIAVWTGDRECFSHNFEDEPEDPVNDLLALHGIDRANFTNGLSTFHNGCPGVKNIYMVTDTQQCQLAGGDVDCGIGLRTATTCGLTYKQSHERYLLERMMDRIGDGNPMSSHDENRWVGDQLPKFHFSSLAPQTYSEDLVYDSMGVNSASIEILFQNNFAFLKSLQKKYHLTIGTWGSPGKLELPQYRDLLRGQYIWEICFEGSRDGISQTKIAIKEKLSQEGGLWVNTNQIGSEFKELGWDKDGWYRKESEVIVQRRRI